MKTIRIESKVMDTLRVTEHNDVKKIKIYMPKTGAISDNQTISFYTNQRFDLSLRFINVKTIDDKQLCINSDHIILIEEGRLIVLQNGFAFFISKEEEYKIIEKGDYGYTLPNTQINKWKLLTN